MGALVRPAGIINSVAVCAVRVPPATEACRLSKSYGVIQTYIAGVIDADEAILYPAVLVTSDKADLATGMLVKAPTLVIEVLSPATEGYDRSQKFALYRRLPSLKEYLLVRRAA